MELLIEFFRYYAYEFDFRHDIVSINNVVRVGADQFVSKPISKTVQAEKYCWKLHDRLSIEDPFEPWYDVAHVIKPAKMIAMKKEFMVRRIETLSCVAV